MDPRFLTTEYVVEANSFEQFSLWKEFSNEVEWRQGGSGIMIQVGELGGMLQEKRPVNISCYWNSINGMNVLFWYGCSQLVDYKMIEEWFKNNCHIIEANSKRTAKCDADNFHQCVHYSREERPPIKIDGLIVPPYYNYGNITKSRG